MTDRLQLIIKFAPARCLSFAWLFRKGEAFLYWIKLKLREKKILYFFILLLTQLDTLLCSWPHMLAISKVLRHVAEQAGLNLFPQLRTHYTRWYPSNGMIQIQRNIFLVTRFFIGRDMIDHTTHSGDRHCNKNYRRYLNLLSSGAFCRTSVTQFNKIFI